MGRRRGAVAVYLREHRRRHPVPDGRDPHPRSREVFTFHRTETLKAWRDDPLSLRSGLQTLPHLKTDGLRACQITAITNLETSLQRGKPRALAQMATGSGKTFTAITEDLDNLPEPDVLMSEIMENLEAAMEQFAAASRA